MRGLLDTSVFIAAESGRPLRADLLPEESAVSVVTLAELQAGVLAAADVATRARRMLTLDAVGDVELIGIDEAAAHTWARMRVELAGSGRRVNVNDLWIAASAASRDLPVVTQDDDFAAIEGIAGLRVVRV
ncbi:type II toxin-antitoxin system VapC family toxin [Pseudonocardia sp. KRD-184]|uniref:Ribonuclease VapC n=1 Tax=Pseudonocardia oceani TaxID=2792013 RepID=A0ABS6U9A7_9PSEU|nr:type II toxin-antitoxin system VapC family toxin [Pseudonocardia oceani]MBW0089529.1 type II toxin-antitoxin system VapC family toxin [Pseudonocardia oceani]MBW0096595.1 type II toxin-antitoxin system VapC family toxin [Pseudonocardia oceani]MBW0109768.1 type II toxin-antitoxin system VapC family toxin [Pseudonocardia oceani]MBW0123413.1 type II toxin-antitoxin system VapC family toxin [Pseudonocardia oceani]MBW0128820.1 type II toxin-antitoxin system VapC family toxin [Pseudonocardia ocean